MYARPGLIKKLQFFPNRQQYETRRFPILAFKDKNVSIEGAMTSMIVNPKEMASEEEITEEVKSWLRKQSFDKDDKERFEEKWALVTEDQRKFLDCLIEEKEKNVKAEAIRKRLIEKFRLENNDATRIIKNAKLRLPEIGFLEHIPNNHTGEEFSLRDPWKYSVRRKILEWSSSN